MNRRVRHWVVCALIAVCSAAATRFLSTFRFFQILNLKALDTHFILRGQRSTSNIMLVVADQKSLDTFHELRMFWHPYYAQAIQAAGEAGAKVVGLDLAFGVPVEKWEPNLDRQLAGAVSESPIPVVCAYAAPLTGNDDKLAIPINMIAASLGLAGFANLTTDPDDFVRRQELIEQPQTAGEGLARSLSFRIAEKYLGADAVFDHGRLTLAGHNIPIDSDRSIFINYAGGPGTFPRVSLADVVEAVRSGRKDKLRSWMSGKIVLVGADALDDRFATPFYTLFDGPRWTTAGVEIHANTLRTLLDRDYLVSAPSWAGVAGIIAAGAATVAVATLLPAGWAAVGLLLIGLAVAAGTQLFFRLGVILPNAEMMVAATLSLIAAVIYRFSNAEKRGTLFRKAVHLFVSEEVAASLDTTGKIGLSGKCQTVTILFTDIRGFTAYTERMCDLRGPEVVVETLNRYMAGMVSIIVKYHGHVNKFIGDGILAVFSDDDVGANPEDHPIRAVRCATEMVTAPSVFTTGAGLHTGLAVLGNVGSADKLEYTVLGDTVNLASRLESLNKECETSLLMSAATYERVRGAVETRPLGPVAVRGKAASIELYTVASLVATPKQPVHA